MPSWAAAGLFLARIGDLPLLGWDKLAIADQVIFKTFAANAAGNKVTCAAQTEQTKSKKWPNSKLERGNTKKGQSVL